MSLSRKIFTSVLVVALGITSSAFAGRAEIEQEIDELKQYYESAVAKSGKMSEQAHEARSELIDAMYDYKQFTQALPYVRDSWAWIEKEGITGREKGRTRYRLGKSLRVAGYFEESEHYLREACERTADKKGEGSRPAVKRCVAYGLVLTNLGQMDESIKVLEKYSGYSESVFGENHPRTAYAMMQLGYAYYRVGRYGEAKKLMKDAYEIFERKKGSGHKLTNLTRFKLAKVQRATGDYDKAERLLRKAYTDFASKEVNQEHQLAFHIMSYLGRVLAEQGRYDEAELLLKQGLEGKKRVMGAGSIKTIHSMISLAQLYLDQKKPVEAGKVMDEVNTEGTNIAEGSHSAIRRDITNGRVNLQLGKLAEAEKFFVSARTEVEEQNILATPMGHAAHLGLGRTYFKQGQYKKAEPLLAKAVELSEKTYGKHNPKTSRSKSYVAQNYAKEKKFNEAVAVYREVMESNTGFLAKRQTFSSRGRAQQEASAQRFLFSYMKLMVNAYQQGIEINADPVSESFAIAENSRSKSLQTAMLGQTARAAARNDYLSELVRREQDLRVRLGEIEDEQIQFVSSESKSDDNQGKRLEEERRELVKELRKIGEEMSYQYPEYDQLVNPKATELAEVQKLLAPAELMLAYFVQKENTLIWAIDKDKATLHVSKLAEKDILARVQLIRAGLDLPIATLEDIPAYNTQIAHELHCAAPRSAEYAVWCPGDITHETLERQAAFRGIQERTMAGATICIKYYAIGDSAGDHAYLCQA
jgi:tetratricopeptide (TPR) repeat protein